MGTSEIGEGGKCQHVSKAERLRLCHSSEPVGSLQLLGIGIGDVLIVASSMPAPVVLIGRLPALPVLFPLFSFFLTQRPQTAKQGPLHVLSVLAPATHMWVISTQKPTPLDHSRLVDIIFRCDSKPAMGNSRAGVPAVLLLCFCLHIIIILSLTRSFFNLSGLPSANRFSLSSSFLLLPDLSYLQSVL